MKLVMSIVLTSLTVCNLALAQEEGPDETRPSPGSPSLSLQLSPVALRLVPARAHQRREKWAAVGLALSGAALTLAGGLTFGYASGADGGDAAGIALTTLGGVALVSGMYVGVSSAGHANGLELVSRVTPFDRGRDILDGAERSTRHGLLGGIALTVAGAALFIAGTTMCFAGLPHNIDGDGGGNDGLFLSGMGLSIAGDAAWFSGSLMTAYYGGKMRGIHEARRALSFAPTGLSGTF